MSIKMQLLYVCVLLSALVSSLSVKQAQRLFDESVWDQVEASPLQVQLLPSQNPDKIRAIITNNGNKVAYYAINQLHTTMNLYNTNDEPIMKIDPHLGGYVAEPEQYQRFAPGESTENEFEIASKFEIDPKEAYYVQVGGFLPFYLEGQHPDTAQKQSQIFEADILQFTAPSNLLETRLRIPQNLMAPSITWSNCSDAEHSQKLYQSIPRAIAQANKAITYVKTGKDRTIMQNFFKDDSSNTQNLIVARLEAIVKSLETKTGPGSLTCATSKNPQAQNARPCAKQGVGAFTENQTGRIVFCAASKRFPGEFIRCNDNNMPGVLLHELTHSRPVFKPNTVDVAYPAAQCKQLSTAKALLNANSFNWLASSAWQGKSC
jgi:deuterolysin